MSLKRALQQLHVGLNENFFFRELISCWNAPTLNLVRERGEVVAIKNRRENKRNLQKSQFDALVKFSGLWENALTFYRVCQRL